MSMYLRLAVFVVILAAAVRDVRAQVGGDRVYEFLNLPSSARITATGGSLIPLKDHDPSLAFLNPALLNPSMHHRFTVSQMLFPGKINVGYASIARNYYGIGTFHAGVHYVYYGKFDYADEFGIREGKFSAGDYAMFIGGSRQYAKYSYGVNLKLIYSQLEKYSSYGLATDFGATFHDSLKLFTASLVLRNIGFQFKPYISGNREPVPFDIQLGISKRMAKAPFRIILIAHSLNKFNIRYEDPALQEGPEIFGDTTSQQKEKKHVADKIFRHLIIATEIYFGKVITLRLGYNHQRRAEMVLDTKKGITGLSFGVGIHTRKITIDYGMAKYHLGGLSNQLTITAALDAMMKRKNTAAVHPE